jgi:hypothetical protein
MMVIGRHKTQNTKPQNDKTDKQTNPSKKCVNKKIASKARQVFSVSNG